MDKANEHAARARAALSTAEYRHHMAVSAMYRRLAALNAR